MSKPGKAVATVRNRPFGEFPARVPAPAKPVRRRRYPARATPPPTARRPEPAAPAKRATIHAFRPVDDRHGRARRPEEHTSVLQSLMRISNDAFCMTKKKQSTKKQLHLLH